ncbi:MAG: ribosomal protein S18 acetylase RimI-like enzyme [Myxococcota bacterium]|jgi:ribosomal protein S18 acetylase RimI-like enzyme
MIRDWKDHLPDESLYFRMADPRDTDIDDFDCGSSPEALEVSSYFKGRQWFDYSKEKSKPPTWQLGTRDEIIGYLSISHGNRPHPDNNSTTKARYLTIYVVGIHKQFQGRINPTALTPERYAATIYRSCEDFFAKIRPDCVGLRLEVRTNNVRAIQSYQKYGFMNDPGGPIIKNGKSTVVMRKIF